MVSIWLLTGRMNAGGAESLIMELLRHRHKNCDVRLVIHSENDDYNGVYDEEISRLNIPVSHLPSVGSVGVKKYCIAFKKLIEENGKPEIIHSHLNALGGIIAYAGYSCGIKHRIIHCHADITYHDSWLNKMKSEISLFIMKWFVNRYGTDFWACSEAAARRLFYSWKNKVIIPNIIDVSKYLNNTEKRKKERLLINASDDEIIIGAIGRIAKIKNYEVIIKTVADLVKDGHKIRFVCYGRRMDEEYYNGLLKMAEEFGVQDYINFQGNCNRVNEVIAAFDIFVMPSITEGFGIAALEAQAAGLPCILSTGIPDEVDMGLGLVKKCPPHDYRQWEEAIIGFRPFVPESTTIQKTISDKGFDSPTECEKIYKSYHEIINKSIK